MRDVRTTKERIDVLDFWWMLELFSPQALPKLTGPNADPSGTAVLEWKPDQPLPWEIRRRPPYPNSKKRYVWQHTVYLGVYKVEDTYKELHRMFFEDRDAYDVLPGGKSACAAVVINEQGRLLAESAVLSSALWAVGRAHHQGKKNPRWADGFPEASGRFAEAIDTFEGVRRRRHQDYEMQESAAGQPRHQKAVPYDASALLELLQVVQREAGIDALGNLATDAIVIKSSPVLEQQAAESTTGDFLNSFYFAEMETVRTQVTSGNIGAALATYLTPESRMQERDRVDVRAVPEAINAGLSADRLPKGRWPENPEHSLAVSQQFAVNEAFHRLGSGTGLMGVNGPPGTGKTTMLRDILAANVVERARRLSALARANQAFEDEPPLEWKSIDGYPRKVPKLRPELTGFEMVVASANNAAVENVSEEIPAADAIHDHWRADADYFRDLATEILTEKATKRGPGQEENSEDDATLSAGPYTSQNSVAWGLIAARLGRKQHRTDFRTRFWFAPKDNEDRKNPAESMQDILKRWKFGEDLPPNWDQACQLFKEAESEVDRILKTRYEAQERIRLRASLQETVESLRGEVANHERNAGALRRSLDVQQHAEVQSEKTFARLKERHSRHLDLKPGWWTRLQFWRKVMEPWRERLTEIVGQLNDVEDQLFRMVDEVNRIQTELDAALKGARETAVQRDRVGSTLADLNAKMVQDERDLGAAYPILYAGEDRELAAPWLDAELDEARSALFFAALDLHRAFFAANADRMLVGLRAAIEVVAGAYPKNLEAPKLQAAWQLFFLVVPLVSTTFASAGRMFAGLGKEAIGWLFIDEAGQASPQYAVGSIWRAKRVVAVGDPLQLQPVVTMPQKAQAAIAKAYRVSDTWVPPRASVQSLADRTAQFGTTLLQGENEVWVSAPLRVHRRCDQPMFGVSNAIAYNNLMVNGVNRSAQSLARFDGDGAGAPPIPFSEWIDMPATVASQHHQPEQMAKAAAVIDELLRRGIDANEIIAISPFRDVADQLEAIAKKHAGVRGGTIHRAQGQQADVVLLVLGGAADKPGAKAWAAEGPNLVNVAVSRAKRRLYVIGDREEWKKQPYFDTLVEALPVRR